MISVVVKWINGSPETFQAGQFLVYESGAYELVGSRTAMTTTLKIVKHAVLIEGHELEWLQSMAVERSLGVLK
ncbi:hypothetical protein D3C87_1542140 [compost metagenome]